MKTLRQLREWAKVMRGGFIHVGTEKRRILQHDRASRRVTVQNPDGTTSSFTYDEMANK